jgi:hypothetical protein
MNCPICPKPSDVDFGTVSVSPVQDIFLFQI